MADDPGEGEGEDEREVELSTVAAIYPELTRNLDLGPFSASIDIPVDPVRGLIIHFPVADGAPLNNLSAPSFTDQNFVVQSNDTEQRSAAVVSTPQDTHRLSHLPPLNLRLLLPDGYPTEQPPVLYLTSQYSWLPEKKLQDLRSAGNTLWKDMGGDQVVFAYIDYLREAAEKGFDLGLAEEEVLDISADLKIALLDFDLRARREKFEKQTFECGICLEYKKGAVCHRLALCSHVFCVECLQDFYSACITEGDIVNVKCIAPNCGSHPSESIEKAGFTPAKEKDKTLEPSELLQIPLEQETVMRYIKLKRKKRLESDPSTVYCPRQWCQGPARIPNKTLVNKEPDSDGTGHGDVEPLSYDRNANPETLPPPAERLAICEDCTFAFCKVCKASWHGEYFVCFPRSQFELTAEERASEDYMLLHTQPCPTCNARAQKTHGCNHMICFKCNTHFCYLCGAYLEKGNPYQHYNTPKSGCYMRLWELEGGDDGEIGQGFGGAGGGLPMNFADGDDVDHDDDDDDDGDVNDDGWAEAPIRVRWPMAPAPMPPNRPQAPAQHAQGVIVRRQNDDGAPGLQRALQMIQDDEEDDWDSDEMEDDLGIGLDWD